MRKRLIELLQEYTDNNNGGGSNHGRADYLLANGVVVIDMDVVSPENRPLITQCFGRPLDEIIEIISKSDRVTTSTMEYQKYKPTCKYGYEGCVWDPAYIKCHHPDWYSRLFGNITPEEASLIPGHSCMSCADNNFLYDDEDK